MIVAGYLPFPRRLSFFNDIHSPLYLSTSPPCMKHIYLKISFNVDNCFSFYLSIREIIFTFFESGLMKSWFERISPPSSSVVFFSDLNHFKYESTGSSGIFLVRYIFSLPYKWCGIHWIIFWYLEIESSIDPISIRCHIHHITSCFHQSWLVQIVGLSYTVPISGDKDLSYYFLTLPSFSCRP